MKRYIYSAIQQAKQNIAPATDEHSKNAFLVTVASYAAKDVLGLPNERLSCYSSVLFDDNTCSDDEVLYRMVEFAMAEELA